MTELAAHARLGSTAIANGMGKEIKSTSDYVILGDFTGRGVDGVAIERDLVVQVYHSNMIFYRESKG